MELLHEKLQRFIDMPEWQRFYMDKEQAAECIEALSLKHNLETALAAGGNFEVTPETIKASGNSWA